MKHTPVKPSDKQLALMRKLANQRGITVPDQAKCCRACSGRWISGLYRKRRGR